MSTNLTDITSIAPCTRVPVQQGDDGLFERQARLCASVDDARRRPHVPPGQVGLNYKNTHVHPTHTTYLSTYPYDTPCSYPTFPDIPHP